VAHQRRPRAARGHGHGGDGIWGQIGIIQVVSDNGTEDFDPVRQAVFRHGVTSVKIYMVVLNGFVRGRLMLNFW
jgi:hypothetical protein